jgi:hypothetical protein
MPTKQILPEPEFKIDNSKLFIRPKCIGKDCKLSGIFNLADKNYICLYCYDRVKLSSKLDIDKIHELDSKQVNNYLKEQ